ncbi:MAG: DUF1642 domain-containing protein [Lacticaseibacillus rhamnosus]
MSEEKIYLIKNDHGEYLTVERTAPWWNSPVGTAVRNIDVALAWAEKYGGHVVTFVEEPKKVVITKEQAEIVERAHSGKFPAASIAFYGDDDEEPLMNAYVNGYTVAKEKKYLVYKELGGKQKIKQVAQAYRSAVFPNTITWSIEGRESLSTLSTTRFAESEIKHYGLQDCEKVWCDSDD